MSVTEIRKGLRRLDFSRRPNAGADEPGTHVVVEFEVPAQLARDQIVLINLGLHDGMKRELKGTPELLAAAQTTSPSYRYRLEGDVA